MGRQDTTAWLAMMRPPAGAGKTPVRPAPGCGRSRSCGTHAVPPGDHCLNAWMMLGLAIVAEVMGEYLGSSQGVGYLILQAEGSFDINTVMAGIVVLTLFPRWRSMPPWARSRSS
jgi:hypothetical protein